MRRFQIKIRDTGRLADNFECDDFKDIEKRVKILRRDKFL